MDEALIESSRAIPARDFEALFESQFNRLARLVRRVVGSPAEAEDLAAEVLWKCYRKNPPATNLQGWLSRVAVRAALDSARKSVRRSRYESLWRSQPGAAEPDELLERDRDRERVRRVLASMKPRVATLLLLRADGLDYRELADAVGVKASSIGTLLARAQAAFRKEYERRHGPR